MILTVTLNPALDVTYGVGALIPGSTHRIRDVGVRAGGKGINVARVLAGFALPVRATGFLGGVTSDQITALLGQSTVEVCFVPIAAETRRTVVVSDGVAATGFWEPGPAVSAGEWRAFVAGYPGLLDGVEVVVLAGSLPPGVPDDAYAGLTTTARSAGARVILDTAGPALRAGLRAGPEVVKPNRGELEEVTGQAAPTPRQALGAARLLRNDTGTAVVATLGGDGLIASTMDGDWRAALPAALPGNPTGAGDACVAALAAGLLRARPWSELLADAVAWSAAAATAPTAGTVDPGCAHRLRPSVVVAAI
jgi:tagatose 6-phosphate kinase